MSEILPIPHRGMIELWADLFALDTLTPDANFFSLGGDSVLALSLMAMIEERFGAVILPFEIFRAPVLKDFTARVATIVAEDAVEHGGF